MSTRTVKVCEECGRQCGNPIGWLVVSSMNIRSAATDDILVRSEAELDLCSQGCLLRYITRTLERAKVNRNAQPARQEPAKTEEPETRKVA